MTPYKGASVTSPNIGLWRASLSSADSDILYDRDTLVARSRDLIRNDGAASVAVKRSADLVVGNRWVLAAKPDAEQLGIDRTAARALGRQMEREFRAWAEDPRKFCDRRRRLSFAGMLTVMARQLGGAEGECLGVMGFKKRPGARYQTTLEVVDPDRLSNPMGVPQGPNMRGGIELDDDGAPVAAHIRKAVGSVGMMPSYEWERVAWETPWGRPIVLHHFEHERAGQNRGVPPFAPILEAFKQNSTLGSAETSNALLNALMGAFVVTDGDPRSIAEALSTASEENEGPWDMRAGFYEDNPVIMNGLRVPVLAPGDKLQLNTSPRQTQSYIAFRNAFLGIMAAQLNLSYEQVSMDFSRTNYSSARAAFNEVWRTVYGRRRGLADGVAGPIYFSVMEEAFASGYIETPPGAPTFDERPDAYCRALWIGPARGTVDPVKDRQAAQIGIEVGLTTLEQECAEAGMDYEDVIDQLQYEAQLRSSAGLQPANVAAILGVAPPSDLPPPPVQDAA